MDFEKFYEERVHEYAKQAAVVHKALLTTYLKHVKKKGVIVDLGCGVGQDVDFFSKKSYVAIGIDRSKNMIRYAQKKYKGIFFVADFFDVKGEKIYDGVWTASSVFTHLTKDKRKRALKNIAQLLKDDGVLGLYARKKTKKRKDFYSYTKDELLSEIQSQGFVCKEVSEFTQNNTSEWFFCVFSKA